MALSRSCPRSDAAPSPAPTASEPPTIPTTGFTPRTSAAAAPLKPSSEIAWTAKLNPRADDEGADRAAHNRDDGTREQGGVDEVLAQKLEDHQWWCPPPSSGAPTTTIPPRRRSTSTARCLPLNGRVRMRDRP